MWNEDVRRRLTRRASADATKQIAPPDAIPEAMTFPLGVSAGDLAVDRALVWTQYPSVRMIVTLEALHTKEFSGMQREGFTSQLTKLDNRFE